mgnify:CR=1 FL=1
MGDSGDIRFWVGIDPATMCGWAVLDGDGNKIQSGTWSLARRRGDGAGMLYVRFERLFRELLASYPGVVCYEQQANRFAGSAHIGLGIIAHLQRICEELSMPYSGIAFSTVKKHATGKGNADKTAMIHSAERRWGLTHDDNEADALWIADAMRIGLG